jgi:hypothetical protein
MKISPARDPRSRRHCNAVCRRRNEGLKRSRAAIVRTRRGQVTPAFVVECTIASVATSAIVAGNQGTGHLPFLVGQALSISVQGLASAHTLKADQERMQQWAKLPTSATQQTTCGRSAKTAICSNALNFRNRSCVGKTTLSQGVRRYGYAVLSGTELSYLNAADYRSANDGGNSFAGRWR